MRQRDLHILTSALHTYTNDWRISAVHANVRRQPTAPDPLIAKQQHNASDVWDEDDGVWSEWTLVSPFSSVRKCRPFPYTRAKWTGVYSSRTKHSFSSAYKLRGYFSSVTLTRFFLYYDRGSARRKRRTPGCTSAK